MTELVAWLAVGLLGAAGLSLYLRVRGLGAEVAAARKQTEEVRAELASAREQLSRATAKQQRLAEESQTLRRKLDKAKRRGAHADRGAGSSIAARIPELEAELEHARQARDAAREESDGLAAELRRLRAAAAEKPVKTEAPAPTLDEAAIAALKTRVETAERETARLRNAEKEHTRALERLKAKHEKQEALYVSIRGELAAKKDRLRTQKEEIERLQALKVAFIDAAPAAADAAIAAAAPVEEADQHFDVDDPDVDDPQIQGQPAVTPDA